jgi:hypothetical protein
MKLFESKTFELPPNGVHAARCFRLVDLGTQSGDFQGKPTSTRKVLLSFELLGDDKQSDGKPFVISRRFSASMNEKSALRAFIETWLSRKLSPQEMKSGFEPATLLGQHALLTVVQAERDGKAYANIQAISALPKGMAVGVPEQEIVKFDLDAPDWSVFESLSQGLKEAIEMSPEYRKATKAPRKVDSKWEEIKEAGAAS